MLANLVAAAFALSVFATVAASYAIFVALHARATAEQAFARATDVAISDFQAKRAQQQWPG